MKEVSTNNCNVGSDELLILDRWACSSWEKCKRLLQPLLFRCSNRRGASQQAGHLHMASPRKCARSNAFTRCPFLNKSCYATWRVRGHSGISEQLLGVGMILSLGRRHAYEKDTLLQIMRLPLVESGVWGSRISLAVKARWRLVGTTRIRASKHGSFWKVPATSLQLSCLEPTHATDHASGGARLWIKGCESFLHLNHQLRKFCSTKFSPFIPKNLRRGSSRCRGQVLDETGSF